MSYAKDSAIRAKRFTEFQELYKKKSMANYHLPLEVSNIVNEYAKPIGIRLDWRNGSSIINFLKNDNNWNNFSKKYLKQKTMDRYGLVMHLFKNLPPGQIINLYQLMRSTSSRMDGVPEWAVKEFLIASNHSSQDPKKWKHTYKWKNT